MTSRFDTMRHVQITGDEPGYVIYSTVTSSLCVIFVCFERLNLPIYLRRKKNAIFKRLENLPTTILTFLTFSSGVYFEQKTS